MDQTTQYFKALFEHKEPDQYILVWEKKGNPAKAPKVSTWHSGYQSAAAHCIKLAKGKNSHVYAGVNLAPADLGPHKRCGKDDIVGVTGLYADIDIATEYNKANKKGSLPETREQALELVTLSGGMFTPTLASYSGNGLHPYWLFREVFLIENREQWEFIANLVARWQARIRMEAARAGWELDSTQDLSRVLRVPGTWNIKDEANPVECKIISHKPQMRFDPTELSEYLDSLPPDVAPVISFPAVEGQQRPVPNAGEQAALDKAMPHIKRNPQASVPYHELEMLFANYPKAKAAYEGKTKALASWSHRDLSIAWAAWVAGWDEQKIFDLLVMFRREKSGGAHTDAARKIIENRTYFGFTIACLRDGWTRVDGKEKLFPEDDGDAFAVANAQNFTESATAKARGDKDTQRAALRTLLGVPQFKTFHKLGPNNCFWEIELIGGVRLPVGTTKELALNHVQLRVVLMEAGITLRNFKADQWTHVLEQIVDSAEEHPDIDLSHSARIAQILQDFVGSQLDVTDDEFNKLIALEKTFVKVSESGRKGVQRLRGQLCLFVPLRQFEEEVKARGGGREANMLQQRMDRLGFVRVVHQYSVAGQGKKGRTSRTYFQAPVAALPPPIRASLPLVDGEGPGDDDDA